MTGLRAEANSTLAEHRAFHMIDRVSKHDGTVRWPLRRQLARAIRMTHLSCCAGWNTLRLRAGTAWREVQFASSSFAVRR